MQNIRTILHPTDFSRTARIALRVAVRMAYAMKARLVVAHVIRSRAEGEQMAPRMPAAADADRMMRLAVQNAMEYMPAHVERAVDVSYATTDSVSAAEGILRIAQNERADAIVMGTHGRRGVRRFILGSVAAEVLHEGQCDVMLVPQIADASLSGRMLVPLDLYGRSQEVVQSAVELASKLKKGVDLLYVIDASILVDLTLRPIEGEAVAALHDVARTRLRELIEEAASDVDIRVHVKEGSPAREIVEVADSKGYALIMMASSGMTPDERALIDPGAAAGVADLEWMVGGVTEWVSTNSAVPVWIRKRFYGGTPRSMTEADQLELTAS